VVDKCAVCRLTMCDMPAIYYSSYLDSQFSLCDVPVRLYQLP